MLLDLTLLTIAAAVGLSLQRRYAGAGRLRERIWSGNYVALIPLAAIYAFLAIEFNAQLVQVFACTVGAWWLTVGLSYLYARTVATTRQQRGALTLIAAFPNTGFIGFPLAHLAFGTEGLRLAVIYDQISLVVPAIVISTIFARHHAAVEVHELTDGSPPSLARQVLLSPPLWTVVVLIALRLTLVRDPVDLVWLGDAIGVVIGPVGFLLLGLSIPLDGMSHAWREVAHVVGSVLVRVAAAPALLWVVARIAGVDVPDALYLIAAMPTAFHALIISRLSGLEVALVRLGVLVSTAVVVVVTVLGVTLSGA